ncbi:MAG: type I phosphomannose isomerase catalytic subunit [Candidatus Weimeria sp.]
MEFLTEKYGIDLDDAVIVDGNKSRITDFLKRAENGEELTVLAFGGSITQGSLASSVEKSYSALFTEWLREKFPKAKIRYQNSGIGGTGSLLGAARLNRDVAAYRPDFILMDFSVNDLNNAACGETFEGAIRQLLSLPSRPAVIALGNVYYISGESSQVVHSEVCRHYGVPMISSDTSIYKAVLTGKIKRREFTPDDLHPNDLGHHFLAEMLVRFVEKTAAEGVCDKADEDISQVPYIFSETYQYIDNASVRLNGFIADETRRTSVQDRFAEGFIGSDKGNSVIFTGYGTSISATYRQVVSATDMSPEAWAIVDGDESDAVSLRGWFDETWGENIRTDIIASGLVYGKHTLEIKIMEDHENDTKPFYLNEVCFAGKKPEIMLMDPVCTHNVWGGTRIRDDFGYQVDGDDIGECWGISAHPNGDGTIRNGVFSGMKLSEVYKDHRELFYRKNPEQKNQDGSCPFYENGTQLEKKEDVFPLLIKIIDAKSDLSIQVHPDDEYAFKNENGSLGKKECWYVLDAPEGASLVVGHNAKTRDELKEMVADGKWSSLIREIPVHKGDFIQIDPGTVHAIKGGLLILETQQNSDITYRVYDYDRLYHGKLRQLHVKQSLDVITVPAAPLDKCFISHDRIDAGNTPDKVQTIYKCDKYEVMRLCLENRASFEVKDTFMTASVIDGSAEIDGISVRKGDFLIIPAGYGLVELSGSAEIILSTVTA